MNEIIKRSHFAGIQIVRWICLLVTVGILCISQKLEVSASSLGQTGLNTEADSSITTNTDSSTGSDGSSTAENEVNN